MQEGNGTIRNAARLGMRLDDREMNPSLFSLQSFAEPTCGSIV